MRGALEARLAVDGGTCVDGTPRALGGSGQVPLMRPRKHVVSLSFL